MKKLKLKPFVLPMIYSILVVGLLITVLVTRKEYIIEKEEKNTVYVTSSILDSYVPVLSVDTSMSKPFYSDEVSIGINFYNILDSEEEKEKSIVFYENTYMPNSGIDYISNNIFDVISVFDGEVIDVDNEELLGNVVTIRHNNDIVSVYQSLSDVVVEKGMQVVSGQIIGKSGTSKINNELNNHLHFELVVNGSLRDPEDFYGKNINDIN